MPVCINNSAKAEFLKNRENAARIFQRTMVLVILATVALCESSLFAQDCNANGVIDSIDISSGTSFDCDQNNIPDECQSVPAFESKPAISTNVDQVSQVIAADIDGDGDLDILSTSKADNKVALFRNIDGLGTFAPEQLLRNSVDGAESLTVADFDLDGDLDVAATARDLATIYWFTNLDGMGGSFFTSTEVTTSAVAVSSVHAADIDGDDIPDLLAAIAGNDEIKWFKNLGFPGGPFGSFFIAAPSIPSNLVTPIDAITADIDNDGDLDIVAASEGDDSIAWFENLDGMGNFSTARLISNTVMEARTIDVADIDGDGDYDVLSASSQDNTVAWFENTDGLGSFGVKQVISASSYAYAAQAVDLDDDGDLDVISSLGGTDRVVWFENTDSAGTFGPERVIALHLEGPVNVATADIDLDGRVDVISANSLDDSLRWHRSVADNDCNANGIPDQCDIAGDSQLDCNDNTVLDGCELTPRFSTPYEVAPANLGIIDIALGDINNDGLTDIISCSNSNFPANPAIIDISLNLDGNGGFSDPTVIASNQFSPILLELTDIDGDDDLDLVVFEFSFFPIPGRTFAIYENLGNGALGPRQEILSTTLTVRRFQLADFNSDGNRDIVIAYQDRVAWHMNLDGMGNFGPQIAISLSLGPQPFRDLTVCDIDNDGDMDVAAIIEDTGVLGWFENTNGEGDFAAFATIFDSVGEGRYLNHADIDHDGDIDLISAYETSAFNGPNKVYWHENIGGEDPFAFPELVAFARRAEVFPGDFNFDSRVDVLYLEDLDVGIGWSKNLDGQGSFANQGFVNSIPSVSSGSLSVATGDLNNDGADDIVVGNGYDFGIIAVFSEVENDCNLNGIPDECDITSLASEDCNQDQIPDECQLDFDRDGRINDCDDCPLVKTGDVNLDDKVDGRDINEIILVVLNPEAVSADQICAADSNYDGDANLLDISPFVDRLLGAQ